MQLCWRHLLKKTEEFTKEKLVELKAFQGSPEMMPEVVREASRRIPFSPLPLSGPSLPLLPPLPEGGEDRDKILQEFVDGLNIALKNRVRVKLTVEGGWGNSDPFDVDGKRLESLITVANTLAVELTFIEVEEFSGTTTPKGVMIMFECDPALQDKADILRTVMAYLERQEGKLEKLKLFQLKEDISPLLQFSKRWEIELIALPDADLDDFWTGLANITSDGRICKFVAPPLLQNPLGTIRLNTVRRLWEISDEMTGFRTGTFEMQEFLGGRRSNLDLEAEWQRILEVIQ